MMTGNFAEEGTHSYIVAILADRMILILHLFWVRRPSCHPPDSIKALTQDAEDHSLASSSLLDSKLLVKRSLHRDRHYNPYMLAL